MRLRSTHTQHEYRIHFQFQPAASHTHTQHNYYTNARPISRKGGCGRRRHITNPRGKFHLQRAAVHALCALVCVRCECRTTPSPCAPVFAFNYRVRARLSVDCSSSERGTCSVHVSPPPPSALCPSFSILCGELGLLCVRVCALSSTQNPPAQRLRSEWQMK